MQRIEALSASQDFRRALTGVRTQRANRNIHRLVRAAAQGAPDVIEHRPPSFVAHIVWNTFDPSVHYVGREHSRF